MAYQDACADTHWESLNEGPTRDLNSLSPVYRAQAALPGTLHPNCNKDSSQPAKHEATVEMQ
jgi:hypothetical protein